MLIMDQEISEPTKISLTQTGEKKIFLEQKEVGKSHKTLGTYEKILGDDQEHLNYLVEKSGKLAKLTNSSNDRQDLRITAVTLARYYTV
jgi:hypothetical protein